MAVEDCVVRIHIRRSVHGHVAGDVRIIAVDGGGVAVRNQLEAALGVRGHLGVDAVHLHLTQQLLQLGQCRNLGVTRRRADDLELHGVGIGSPDAGGKVVGQVDDHGARAAQRVARVGLVVLGNVLVSGDGNRAGGGRIRAGEVHSVAAVQQTVDRVRMVHDVIGAVHDDVLNQLRCNRLRRNGRLALDGELHGQCAVDLPGLGRAVVLHPDGLGSVARQGVAIAVVAGENTALHGHIADVVIATLHNLTQRILAGVGQVVALAGVAHDGVGAADLHGDLAQIIDGRGSRGVRAMGDLELHIAIIPIAEPVKQVWLMPSQSQRLGLRLANGQDVVLVGVVPVAHVEEGLVVDSDVALPLFAALVDLAHRALALVAEVEGIGLALLSLGGVGTPGLDGFTQRARRLAGLVAPLVGLARVRLSDCLAGRLKRPGFVRCESRRHQRQREQQHQQHRQRTAIHSLHFSSTFLRK